MASLNNIIRLLDGVIGNYPENLPRSNLEIIQILRELKPKWKVYYSHVLRMKMVDDDELKELCGTVASLFIHVTGLAEDLIKWASGNLTLPSSPSGTVLEALKTIRTAFRQFERLADKKKPKFETRPKLFRECCFAYIRGCFNYSIIFQRLLYPEDDCDHLAFYTEHLECGFESSFKFDTKDDFETAGGNQSFARRIKTLYDCIPPADQIPRYCHLRAQPGKPVCPQFYRNPGFYGPRLLRNQNHPANRDYFVRQRMKRLAYIMENPREAVGNLPPSPASK